MRQPLWILNSAIALLVGIVFLFMFFSRQKIPYREPIEPEVTVERIKRDELKINISKIYEDDIFDTYKKELPTPVTPVADIPLPQPPIPAKPEPPALPKPEFLDPLNITLKGIIVVANDATKNRAIIKDNQTDRENTYKVGNMIQDAQLIRIFNNKVIFLRSNGQQEVLYLREKDAQLDPTFAALGGWTDVIKKIDDYHYTVSPKLFVERIQNLAQLIDIMDLTTAYQKGRSIGCRVGTVMPNSLSSALGFQTGDIITHVDNIPATTTTERFHIYKQVSAKKLNELITVTVLRQHEPHTLVYTLEDFSILDTIEAISPAKELALEQKMKEKQLKALQQKHQFKPAVQDLKRRERNNMLKRGRMPTSQTN